MWQRFFENNPWIFGSSLRLVFLSTFQEDKLESTTTGASIVESGKRVDALMKTAGAIGSLCFIEVKTHTADLLQKKEYRAECWAPSNELSGAVVQTQKTVQKALKSLGTRVEIKSADGWPGESAYLYQPKAYVVAGSLKQFQREAVVNETQFSSFELYRRHLVNPEIITFDELFARASAFVEHDAQRA